MSTRYYSTWGDVWFFSIIVAILVILGYLKNGINDYLHIGVFLGGLYILQTVYFRYKTYVEITDDRTLQSVGQRSFVSDRLDIYAIKNVCRARAFLAKSWGSLIIIYIVDDNGKLRQANIREKNYDEQTLKELLTHLKKINPSIKLDPIYEQLLSGTLPEKLHSIPSEHTPNEVDAKVRQELHIKE